MVVLRVLAVLPLLLAGPVSAMSPEQLYRLLQDPSADHPVVVDIRSRANFVAGRIPGSVHIATAGLENRSVPPFGDVVLVWDGLDRAAAEQALLAFNGKPGIDAELLNGGYPGWLDAGGRGGGAAGLRPAEIPGLTWQQLMQMASDPDLVLVDLRHSDGTGEAVATASLTDLATLLPEARVIEPLAFERTEMRQKFESARGLDRQGLRERSVPRWLKGQGMNRDGLYVLIDSGDGRLSEQVARRLSVRGMKRVFVLLGGERALRAGGDPAIVTRTAAEAGSDE